MNTWNEQTAREWFDAQGGIGLPFTMRRMRSGVHWTEPRPLGDRVARLGSTPHECLSDALRAGAEFPDLIVAIGYSFRPESAMGISHVFNFGGELHEHPVDLAIRRLGLPAGYLSVIPDAPTLERLARLNGIKPCPALLNRHATIAPAPGSIAPEPERTGTSRGPLAA